MAVENLWGDLPLDDIQPTPLAILKTQAIALEEQSRGLLTGRVNTTSGINSEEKEVFIHIFSLLAPALGNYSVEVLRAVHPIELYPVRLRDSMSDRIVVAHDDAGLKEQVGRILQSDRLRQVIKSLLSQIADVKTVAAH